MYKIVVVLFISLLYMKLPENDLAEYVWASNYINVKQVVFHVIDKSLLHVGFYILYYISWKTYSYACDITNRPKGFEVLSI